MPSRVLFLCLMIGTAQGWVQQPKPPAPLPPGIVQVAVHYGPQKDAFLSGVVVGDGRTVLTDGAALEKAEEIAIAFADGEALDAVMPQVRTQGQIGVVPLPEQHSLVVSLMGGEAAQAPADDALDANAGGAPKAFEFTLTAVRLRPVRIPGKPMRWQVSPNLPLYFRGGPLLDSRGRLMGLLLQEGEGGTLVGVPLASFAGVLGPQNLATVATMAVPTIATPQQPVPVVPELQLPLPTPATGWVWKDAQNPPAQPPPPSLTSTPPEVASPASPADMRPATDSFQEAGDRIRSSNELIQKGDYPAAVDALEEALRLYPGQAQVHYYLAFAYWHKAMHKRDGNLRGTMERTSYKKALQEFQTFLEKLPNDPRAPEARMRLELLRQAQYGYRPKPK